MDKNLNNNINDKDHFNVNDDEDNEDLDDDDDDDEICDYDNDDYDDEQFVDDDDLINLHDQDIQIDDDDDDDNDKRKNDLEYFDYYCTTYQDAKNILNEIISNITNRLKLNYSLAKLLLIQCKWDANEILDKFFMNDNQYFFDKGIITIDKNLKQLLEQTMITTKLIKSNIESSSKITKTSCCNVCLENKLSSQFISLICEHFYCIDCWFNYCRIQIDNRQSILKMTCMNCECKLLLPEDFVHFILQQKQQQSSIDFSPIIKELTQKYDEHLLRESIDSFNRMRLCINNDCKTVLIAQEKCAPKRVTCKNCNNSFCFQCGNQYHAPTDCKTIILWYRKCADDSETAHYIRGHTKLCPNCNSCIEKNGGCNHMSCYSCKHEFCWVCLGQWSIHGPQYFKCSKYKENPDIQNESERAREALKKYLFYYERWDNHMKSLELEDENRKRIQEKIDNELNRNNGTWIDWQYLLRGAKILSKCRYTLQYTYPYAYYMQSGSQKELFEYQQAALENEIENLAWKIENADTTDRGALENQMTIVEKRRTTLLYNFFQY